METIKASELRIGNLVYYNNGNKEIGKVTGLQSTVTMQCYVFIDHRVKSVLDLDMIEPIPITEELLFEFGFEISDKSNEFWTFYVLKNNWFVSFSKHDEPSAGVEKGKFYMGDDYKELKYIHKLQNLYFALTNKELKKI